MEFSRLGREKNEFSVPKGGSVNVLIGDHWGKWEIHGLVLGVNGGRMV